MKCKPKLTKDDGKFRHPFFILEKGDFDRKKMRSHPFSPPIFEKSPFFTPKLTNFHP